MDLPKRKQNRFIGYDYSRNGAYFITICIKDRHELFWTNVGANIIHSHDIIPLSTNGFIVEHEINRIAEIYKNTVLIDKYIIMPNHIHMIILLQFESGRIQFAPTISRIIKQFKGSITKQIGFQIWQKSYHDHIIRNETNYKKIWNYIDTNPQNWEQDCFYPKPPTP